jgi:hypothetical protein
MDGDRIIRRVGDAIRFVVAEDETFLTMQELHQDLGETRVAVIEHADMSEPRQVLKTGVKLCTEIRAVGRAASHRRSSSVAMRS